MICSACVFLRNISSYIIQFKLSIKSDFVKLVIEINCVQLTALINMPGFCAQVKNGALLQFWTSGAFMITAHVLGMKVPNGATDN